MIRLAISVEGLTELEFCNKVLRPHLEKSGIFLTPISLGGNISIERVIAEIKKLLFSYDYVSSFYDFYGFKNKGDAPKQELEDKLYKGINNPKFIPYIQRHEFEALLFSNIDIINQELNGNEKRYKELEKIILEYPQPEDINDSVHTAPSKRLEKLFENYQKGFQGTIICQNIGLNTIRNKCNGFHEWLLKLEKLSF